MYKSFLSPILLLTAFVLIPSCVEGPDGPSATDPQTIGTEGEAMAGDEAEDSGELGAANVAPTGTVTTLGAWDCNADRLCLWSDTNFQGARLELVPLNQCQNLGAYGFNNTTRSWFNRWSGLWTLYTDGNCTGSRFQATDGQSAFQMSTFWDKNISSICHGSGCP
jgi:hypothetical protein